MDRSHLCSIQLPHKLPIHWRGSAILINMHLLVEEAQNYWRCAKSMLDILARVHVLCGHIIIRNHFDVCRPFFCSLSLQHQTHLLNKCIPRCGNPNWIDFYIQSAELNRIREIFPWKIYRILWYNFFLPKKKVEYQQVHHSVALIAFGMPGMPFHRYAILNSTLIFTLLIKKQMKHERCLDPTLWYMLISNEHMLLRRSFSCAMKNLETNSVMAHPVHCACVCVWFEIVDWGCLAKLESISINVKNLHAFSSPHFWV